MSSKVTPFIHSPIFSFIIFSLLTITHSSISLSCFLSSNTHSFSRLSLNFTSCKNRPDLFSFFLSLLCWSIPFSRHLEGNQNVFLFHFYPVISFLWITFPSCSQICPLSSASFNSFPSHLLFHWRERTCLRCRKQSSENVSNPFLFFSTHFIKKDPCFQITSLQVFRDIKKSESESKSESELHTHFLTWKSNDMECSNLEEKSHWFEYFDRKISSSLFS